MGMPIGRMAVGTLNPYRSHFFISVNPSGPYPCPGIGQAARALILVALHHPAGSVFTFQTKGDAFREITVVPSPGADKNLPGGSPNCFF